MKSLWKCFVHSALAIGMTAGLSTTVSAQDAGAAGVVRIAKPRTASVSDQQLTPASAMQAASCNPVQSAPAMPPQGGCNADMSGGAMMGNGAVCDGSCDFGGRGGYGRGGFGRGGYYGQDWRTTDWQNSNGWGSGLRARTQAHSMAWESRWYGHSGYGPSIYDNDCQGNAMLDYFRCKFGYFIPTGGGGRGVPWTGHYARVYPVNPHYSDPRDGQAYAAQGYGIPVSVPLAPVVGHTYDYSWGIPSSRLTPVSHPAY